MKINEALDIINDTRTVRAKFEKSKLTFAAKENLGGGHWGFWFLRMNEGALSWNSVNLAYPYLNSVSAQDLARVMDVVQRLIDTPVSERKNKYRLVLAGDDSNLCWVIGVMHSDLNDDLFDSYWAINNENYLKKKGYQTRFTDADLKKIADGDQDMLDRLTVLKREAPDNVD